VPLLQRPDSNSFSSGQDRGFPAGIGQDLGYPCPAAGPSQAGPLSRIARIGESLICVKSRAHPLGYVGSA